jgi:hypothetical protein
MRLCLLILLLALPASAANHFVSPNGAGTKSGADWTNACQGFIGSCLPTSLVRGDTYYVADSDGVNYPNVDFNKAVSGSLVITIRKCTTTDGVSSGAAGYASTLCDGFAKWSGALSSGDMVSFSTGFWTFDGITPQTRWATTGFGFRVDTSVSTNAAVYLGGSNNLVRNVEIIGDNGDGNGAQAGGGNKGVFFGPSVGSTGNHTVEYIYTHDNGSQPTFIVSNGNTLQYSRIERNESTAGDHSEGTYISSLDNATPVTNTTIRYNFYKNIEGTGDIAMGPVNTVAVYGNVFWGTTGIAGGGIGNGVITRFTQWNVATVVVYNNTCVDAVKCVSFFVGGDVGTTSSVTSRNNLSYNTTMNNDNVTSHDYSWCQTSDAFCPAEANLQTSSSNPFVNYSGGDFHLAADTNAWTALSSPYNVDADGVTRTSSRGALQFVSGVVSPSSILNGGIIFKGGAQIK